MIGHAYKIMLQERKFSIRNASNMLKTEMKQIGWKLNGLSLSGILDFKFIEANRCCPGHGFSLA